MAVPGHFKRVYFSYFIQTLLLNWLYLDLNCSSLDSEITAIRFVPQQMPIEAFFYFFRLVTRPAVTNRLFRRPTWTAWTISWCQSSTVSRDHGLRSSSSFTSLTSDHCFVPLAFPDSKSILQTLMDGLLRVENGATRWERLLFWVGFDQCLRRILTS